jgi:hypothetical protein
VGHQRRSWRIVTSDDKAGHLNPLAQLLSSDDLGVFAALVLLALLICWKPIRKGLRLKANTRRIRTSVAAAAHAEPPGDVSR